MARPNAIAKRSSAEKSPVRKAAPAKSSASPASAAKSAKTGKPAKPAAPAAKSAAKTRATAKPAPQKSAKPAARQTSKAQTARTPATKPPAKNVASPAKSRTTPARPAGAQKSAAGRTHTPRQPTRDESAALKAFERAHKEFTRGRFAEARQLFRTLIDEHAGVAEVTARARTYLAIAEARLRSESTLPRDAESLYDRGVIELNRGDYVAAQELFERALKRDPQAPHTHYALAATRSRLGNIELALQSLERALELGPGLRLRAQYDLDFAALRNEPEYERLIFSSRA